MTVSTLAPYRVGVVGCGTMGGGIAEACLRSALDVRVLVSAASRVDAARQRLTGALDRAVAKGRLAPADRDAALGRLTVTADVGELADRELVVEAVVEDLDVKRRVFKALDGAVADPGAVLASTTSSLLVADLAAATGRPGCVVGTHFFNPVPVMALVEVVTVEGTGERAAATVEAFVTAGLGKQVVRARDRCGFVVNALLVPYLMAAARMYEDGVASVEDIDRGMTLGCGHPMGPLALMDLIGIDTIATVAQSMADNGGPVAEVPALLTRMARDGRLGRKTGHGFHRYDPPPGAPRGAA
ncbi:3-hydroxybutyryl-CoA dehydrogenase [Catenulispora rubra]|uniref:3-hydroxybutyryl-CoA dehydrogenase n=1 Tax=Catenulispora rubra TaxID=280293 RepID=UPI00189248DC|nr:3-hydroxybutyryl-CoA dehydrogenase [Catenulispora rubra]